jgi:hypothetical protein
MEDKLGMRPLIRVPVSLVLGVGLFWGIDKVFRLTEGAFHHLFGGGILWTYLLVPALVAIIVGFLIGKWGKYWGAVPPMIYILYAYLMASKSADFGTIGMPMAPFMMIFFITVPEVAFAGGWAGEVLRKRYDVRKKKKARLREASVGKGLPDSEGGVKR